ncbi:hypothetical protein HOY82DRAFT_670468 [Tuber indicum]|nr:hypothetical protein HOY82DRAFT_670468 [Tuber indicum]
MLITSSSSSTPRSSPFKMIVSVAYTWLIIIVVNRLTFDWSLAEPDVCPRQEDLTRGMDRSLIRGAPGTDTDPRMTKVKDS